MKSKKRIFVDFDEFLGVLEGALPSMQSSSVRIESIAEIFWIKQSHMMAELSGWSKSRSRKPHVFVNLGGLVDRLLSKDRNPDHGCLSHHCRHIYFQFVLFSLRTSEIIRLFDSFESVSRIL